MAKARILHQIPSIRACPGCQKLSRTTMKAHSYEKQLAIEWHSWEPRRKKSLVDEEGGACHSEEEQSLLEELNIRKVSDSKINVYPFIYLIFPAFVYQLGTLMLFLGL